jgi:hypothetical protein
VEHDDGSHAIHLWLVYVYGHNGQLAKPAVAARMLATKPDLIDADPILACAAGDEAAVRRAIAVDPGWPNRIPDIRCPQCGGALGRPPMVAATHSVLGRLSPFREGLRACARVLLDAGADPNQTWSENDCDPLSALYGAAGINHDPEMTRLILAAGANPNDGESLYHSTEAQDLTCMRLLLEAGATVGSNVLHHQLDTDNLDGLRLLLAYAKAPDDTSNGLGSSLLWAIRRRRSREHIEALLTAGADPRSTTEDGVSAYRMAVCCGLPDIADVLSAAGAAESLSEEDRFVAACARGDRTEAQRILASAADIVGRLSNVQLRQLPDLAATGAGDAVRLMVELGWPVDVRGGDWDASALNHAVFRGDASLTRFLLERGASWIERHGHDDNVHGTLAWASRNLNEDRGDWIGCARALVDHGLPVLELEGDYSDEVATFLEAERTKLRARNPATS